MPIISILNDSEKNLYLRWNQSGKKPSKNLSSGEELAKRLKIDKTIKKKHTFATRSVLTVIK